MATKTYALEPHPKYGFLQVKPTPTPEEIARFYAEEFYSANYGRLNDSALEVQLEDPDFYEGRWEDICVGVQQVLGKPLAGLRVLDIGCGWGQALLHFKNKGMGCWGFDPSPEAVASGKKQGLNLQVSGFEKMDVFPERFDVVTLLNVLEHLADPASVVADIRAKVLKPGGVLVIDVPNEFNAFQTAGQEAHGLEQWWVAPPSHLNYFSGTTLSRLLEGTGYKVRLKEASFPLEMFLLMGKNYVADPALGKRCHKERVVFERNLRTRGRADELRRFYRALAEQDLGRQVVVYAVA